MTKYRIVTKPGSSVDTLYSVQHSFFFIFWIEDVSYCDLKNAQDYMKECIRKRDFRHEVIVSE